LTEGNWTITVEVDDDESCPDRAEDAVCTRDLVVFPRCPPQGDTHCLGLQVSGPDGNVPGTYAATGTAEDYSGDPISYTFSAQRGDEPPILVVGPPSRKHRHLRPRSRRLDDLEFEVEARAQDVPAEQAVVPGLAEGDLNLGRDEKQVNLTVIQTPGHSPGSICLYWAERKVLITGDLVFNGSVGRTDFPGGSITGAPKFRAMEIISELEPSPRGPYAGAVGYFGFNGNMDFCITIRTITIQRNRISIQVGAGIVADIGEDVESVRVGDRVFPHHHVPCYKCHYCLHGSETMCPHYRSSNYDPGGFSEYFRVPAWNVQGGGVLTLPDDMSFEEASS
jgi:hypothetical protein